MYFSNNKKFFKLLLILITFLNINNNIFSQIAPPHQPYEPNVSNVNQGYFIVQTADGMVSVSLDSVINAGGGSTGLDSVQIQTTTINDTLQLVCPIGWSGGVSQTFQCDTIKNCCPDMDNFRVFNYHTNLSGDDVVNLEYTKNNGDIVLDSIIFPASSAFAYDCTDPDYIWVNNEDNSGEHACDAGFTFGHSGSRSLLAGDGNTVTRTHNAVFGLNNTGDRYDLIGGLGNSSNNGYTLIGGLNNAMVGQYGGFLAGEGNTITNARYSAAIGSNNAITSSWRSLSVGGSNSIISTSPNNYQLGSSNTNNAGSYSFQVGQLNENTAGFAYQLGSTNTTSGTGTSKYMFGKANVDNRTGTIATSFTLGRNNTMNANASDGLIVGESNTLNTPSSVIIGQGNTLNNGTQGNFIMGRGIAPISGLAGLDRTFVNYLRLWDYPEIVASADSVLTRDNSQEGEIKLVAVSDLVGISAGNGMFDATNQNGTYAVTNANLGGNTTIAGQNESLRLTNTTGSNEYSVNLFSNASTLRAAGGGVINTASVNLSQISLEANQGTNNHSIYIEPTSIDLDGQNITASALITVTGATSLDADNNAGANVPPVLSGNWYYWTDNDGGTHVMIKN